MNAQMNINRKINLKGNYCHMYTTKTVQFDWLLKADYQTQGEIYDSNILLVKGNKSNLLFSVVRKVNRHIPKIAPNKLYDFSKYKGIPGIK